MMNMSEYLQSLTAKQLDTVIQLTELEKGRRKEEEWNNLVATVAASAPPLPKDIADKIKSGEIRSSSYAILDPDERKARGID